VPIRIFIFFIPHVPLPLLLQLPATFGVMGPTCQLVTGKVPHPIVAAPAVMVSAAHSGCLRSLNTIGAPPHHHPHAFPMPSSPLTLHRGWFNARGLGHMVHMRRHHARDAGGALALRECERHQIPRYCCPIRTSDGWRWCGSAESCWVRGSRRAL
jgi:hypothetical protein